MRVIRKTVMREFQPPLPVRSVGLNQKAPGVKTDAPLLAGIARLPSLRPARDGKDRVSALLILRPNAGPIRCAKTLRHLIKRGEVLGLARPGWERAVGIRLDVNVLDQRGQVGGNAQCDRQGQDKYDCRGKEPELFNRSKSDSHLNLRVQLLTESLAAFAEFKRSHQGIRLIFAQVFAFFDRQSNAAHAGNLSKLRLICNMQFDHPQGGALHMNLCSRAGSIPSASCPRTIFQATFLK